MYVELIMLYSYIYEQSCNCCFIHSIILLIYFYYFCLCGYFTSSKLVYVSLNLDVYSLQALFLELDLEYSTFRVMLRKLCAFLFIEDFLSGAFRSWHIMLSCFQRNKPISDCAINCQHFNWKVQLPLTNSLCSSTLWQGVYFETCPC